MAPKEKHSVLQAEDLHIGYSSKKHRIPVAGAVSFSAGKGEFIGIVGANGSGKSTLIRTLAGLQPALAGEIRINDLPLSRYSATALASVLSLVLTEPIPVKNLTVAEVIALGRQPHTNWIGTLTKDDRSGIENAMQTTRIEALSNKRCYELSDGQLQKVMIARALAQQTGVIILDEPTTHLDLYYKAYVLKLLKQIAKEQQKTVIFSSHEIDMTIQLCDKMLVMTNHNVYFDTPIKLIEKGRFGSLFPKDFIDFDTPSGRFKIKD